MLNVALPEWLDEVTKLKEEAYMAVRRKKKAAKKATKKKAAKKATKKRKARRKKKG
jgi:hypothetical protein